MIVSSCKTADNNTNQIRSELTYSVWQDYAINPPVLPNKIVKIFNEVYEYKKSSKKFDLLIRYSYTKDYYDLLSFKDKGRKLISKSEKKSKGEIQFTQLDSSEKINIVPSSDKYWELFHNPDFLGFKLVDKKTNQLIKLYTFTGAVDENDFIKSVMQKIRE